MIVVGLLIVLAIWNSLGGLVAALIPFAPFVWRALKRAERTQNERDARVYLRWLALNHLWNHLVTVAGSLLFCVVAAEEGGPSAWLAWAIFAIYFLTMRLGHIIDAATRLVRADAMPAASGM